jgi:flagellar protein FlaJ
VSDEEALNMAKKIKARREKSWLAATIAFSLIVSMIFVVLAVLSQIEVINVMDPVNEDGSMDQENATGYDLGQGMYVDGDMVNFIIIALIPPFLLPGYYIVKRGKTIKDIEYRLPDFLRDVAEAGRFGMTLAGAVVVASRGRYGKLTPEIKKMAARIDWGVPASEAIRLFAETINTPVVNRVSAIIMKSNDAGGNVADVLTLVSNDTKQEQLMEKERKLSMSTYIAVIYIAFMVFLVTIIILNSTFLPQMEKAGEETSSIMEDQSGPAAGAGGAMIQAQAIGSIKFAYLIASLAHAMGDGLIAGALSTGKIKNGLIHSAILIIATFVVLRMLLIFT